MLFVEDMNLYIDNTKKSSPPKKKQLELINEFNHIAEYKINVQKSIIFLYTCSEQSKNK